MTRAEALRRLEGTWNFDLEGGRVRVRDARLLQAIDALRREDARDEGRPRTVPGRPAPLLG